MRYADRVSVLSLVWECSHGYLLFQDLLFQELVCHEIERFLPHTVPQHLERLAVQSVRETHGIFPVGQIHHVIGNIDTMWVGEGTDAPTAQIVAIPVENHHRRVFALEHVDPVLRIRGNRAHIAERLSRW